MTSKGIRFGSSVDPKSHSQSGIHAHKVQIEPCEPQHRHHGQIPEIPVPYAVRFLSEAIAGHIIPDTARSIHHGTKPEPLIHTPLIFCKPVLGIAIVLLVLIRSGFRHVRDYVLRILPDEFFKHLVAPSYAYLMLAA